MKHLFELPIEPPTPAMTEHPLRDANHFSERYGMNPPHSEVVLAQPHVQPGKVLDLGCGSGRNALYLASRGFEVTALDVNPAALETLRAIVAQERLSNIDVREYDMHEARIGGNYDFIVCTVTLMFLQSERVADVIADMQRSTRSGGYNLIVAAMSTDQHPCPVGFPSTLGEGQLREAYAGWQLLKYNEDLGTLHNGVPLQFATMLAQKPV